MSTTSRKQSSRRSRTFTGCLTCRRRKVKCPDVNLPCGACCRLELQCIPPITKNIRLCTGQSAERCSSSALSSPTVFQPTSLSTRASDMFGIPTPNADLECDDRFSTTHSPSQALDCLEPAADESGELFISFDEGILGEINFNLEPKQGFDENNFDQTSLYAINSPESIWLTTDREPAMSMTIKEMAMLQYYKSNMVAAFSVKSPQWNIFTYLLSSTKELSRSPLKSSLIAWAATHIAPQDGSYSELAAQHYAAASAEALGLCAELAAELLHSPVVAAPSATTTQPSKMSMLLASAFVLCQCDIITCNTGGFRTRLESLRDLLSSLPHQLSSSMSAIDHRLLLWLSYLNTRAAVFQFKDERRRWGPENSTLFDALAKFGGAKSIYLRSRAYLNEGFGSSYPSSELHGDMLQDTVNAKFLEIMALLGEIVSLESNGPDAPPSETLHEHSTPSSTREKALGQQISDLSEECDLALKGFVNGNDVLVVRTSYHWLNLKNMCHSAMILLSRYQNMEVRTDAQAQRASQQIIRTTLKLRNAGFLHNPHSMLSPFSLVIALVEIVDEVYRDWALKMLESFESWGLHVSTAIIVLKRVLEKQDRLNRRCDMREVIRDLGCGLIL